MSDKVYVGRRCASVSKPPALDPISKIILWIDSENCFEAGDDSGREFEITCPYGTQQMAEDLLQKLGGYVYRPMQAGDALLDPAAELGDAVTVDGCYTKLASMELSFDSLMASDIAAPGASELPQEYSFSSAEKILNRKIARNRSLITKTAEQIRLEVIGEIVDENGNPISVASAITQTAQKITSEITEEYKQYTDGRLGDLGKDEDGEAYTVASKIEQTAKDITLEVTGYFDTGEDNKPVSVSSSIKAALGSIALSVSSEGGSSTFQITSDGVEIATTTLDLTVDAANISGNINLGGLLAVYEGLGSSEVGGYLGYDNGFASSTGIGIRSYQNGSGPQMVCTDEAARISYTAYAGGNIAYQTGVICGSDTLTLDAWELIQIRLGQNLTATYDIDSTGIYSIGGLETLGTFKYPWADVYAAETSMSDLLARVEALEKKSAS